MPAEFRYRRLGYVALNVTDLARADVFYRDIVGLQYAGDGADGERFYRCGPRHHDLALHAAAAPGVRRIGWEMASPEDLETLRTHAETVLGLTVHQVPAERCAALGLVAALRVVEPHTGAVLEFHTAMAAADEPYAPTHTRIARLGHVVLGTPRQAEAERYFLDALNFRASDRIENAVTFLRCFPNPRHHSLGLARSDSACLHHVNFMVTDIDDIGRALYRMQAHGVPIVFGPGRHPPSESIFLYFLDPDGITLEYSFGMEEFPEIDPRPPRLLPFARESIDYWGAVPDARFGRSGAIAPAPADLGA